VKICVGRLVHCARMEEEGDAENWNHRRQYTTGTESRGRGKVGARYWRSGSNPPNGAGSLPDLAITKTNDEVIVYHADGLHMGVHDRRTNETESAMLEVPAECIGFG
jgi:hypothetical protein